MIDLSKVIGLIGRGGRYFPSNERSQEKWNRVFDAIAKQRGFDDRPTFLRRDELGLFRDLAKASGYRVTVIERGLNR